MNDIEEILKETIAKSSYFNKKQLEDLIAELKIDDIEKKAIEDKIAEIYMKLGLVDGVITCIIINNEKKDSENKSHD